MRTLRISLVMLGAALVIAACAGNAEREARRQQVAEDIENILAQPAPEALGEMQKCLSDVQVRSYRVLDSQHLLFEGSRDRAWVNTLRSRCPDLDYGDILVVRHMSGSRTCEFDRFRAAEWFDFPSAGRRPANWGTSPQCTLGKFQPVTPDQIAEIKAVLDRD